ncbi:MAG: cell division protein FtsX [Candidatus Aminicenantes bacterium]
MVLYLEKDISPAEIRSIEEKLKTHSSVKKAQFTSSKLAMEKLQQRFPEMKGIIENLEVNPLPSSFEISIMEENLSSVEIQTFLQQMKSTEGVDDVQFNREWVEKMQSLSRLVKAVGFFLGGILILASFFIISNVIKLNVFARREEIEILRLVGATNTFIRIPFLAEGTILGIGGGALSLVLLLGLIKIFPLYLGTSLGVLQDLINFRFLTLTQSVLLVGGGAFIGFLGSLSSLARFLKGEETMPRVM